MAIGFKRFGMGNIFLGMESIDNATYNQITDMIEKLGQFGNIICIPSKIKLQQVNLKATGYYHTNR
jgi:hypothetical protein